MKKTLDKWYAQLPYHALESIHNTSFYDLSYGEIEKAVSSCKKEWKSMSIGDRESIFYEHYEDFSDFTMDAEISILFKKVKDKIEKI